MLRRGGYDHVVERTPDGHFVVIDGEMDNAAPELKEQFFGISIALILLYSICDGLFGQAVFEFKGGDRQSVDEDGEV